MAARRGNEGRASPSRERSVDARRAAESHRIPLRARGEREAVERDRLVPALTGSSPDANGYSVTRKGPSAQVADYTRGSS